jgi:hypothetical protein
MRYHQQAAHLTSGRMGKRNPVGNEGHRRRANVYGNRSLHVAAALRHDPATIETKLQLAAVWGAPIPALVTLPAIDRSYLLGSKVRKQRIRNKQTTALRLR